MAHAWRSAPAPGLIGPFSRVLRLRIITTRESHCGIHGAQLKRGGRRLQLGAEAVRLVALVGLLTRTAAA